MMITEVEDVSLILRTRYPRNVAFIYCYESTYFFKVFIYLFLAVLGLRFCARAFSSCSKRGPLFIALRGPLTIAASLVAEHRLQTLRLSNCGSRVQLLRGMWDPPRPGLKPVSPALAGRLSTTAPPGKPRVNIFFNSELLWWTIRKFNLVRLGCAITLDIF